MKTLYLVRHAKAVSSEFGIDDFKRALSSQGVDDAEAMGERLRQKGISPDFIVSSPTDRALETAHIFAQHLNYPFRQVALHEEIYEQGVEEVKSLIAQLNNAYNTVMLFGHEPTLSQLASLFLKDTEAIELRTTGVIGISFEIERWQEIDKKAGTLTLFDFPVRATPKVFKKAKKAIARSIAASIEHILNEIDAESSKQVENVLEKTSRKLAKELAKVMQASKIEELAGIVEQKRIDRLPQPEQAKKADAAAPSADEPAAAPAKPKRRTRSTSPNKGK